MSKKTKKAAPKKAAKKVVKKAAPKKAVKNTTKKAAPKKSAKKTTKKAAPKKAAKKSAKTAKATVKKAAPKKVSKKPAAKPGKKTAPKPGKKAAKKTASRAKKAVKKVITTTTTTVTTTVSTSKIAPKETHYLLILDESGSMGNIQKETLSGLNEQINTIKRLDAQYTDQEYFVSIVKFDDVITPLFDDVPSEKMRLLDSNDYKPRAMTALYDAVGSSVNKLKAKLDSKLTSGEAEAFVVILTDGLENASKEYDSSKIKNLIETLEKTGSWTFTFIGANQDSVLTARDLGVSASNTANFTASGVGSTLAFGSLSSAMGKRAMYRSKGIVSNDSYLSEVVCANNIGEDATMLDLSGTVSDEDIQEALKNQNSNNSGNSNK